MKRPCFVVLMLLAGPLALALSQSPAEDKPSEVQLNNAAQPRKPFEAPAVEDPDATIRRQMDSQWSSPERKKWRIDYRPIAGMTNRSSWHIAGTHWWVRMNSEVYKLDDLDKKQVYEIDAVALNQNYGVIDFYVYRAPQKTSR